MFWFNSLDRELRNFCPSFYRTSRRKRGYDLHCVSTLVVIIQLLSRVWLFFTPWTAARQASLSITNSENLLKLMSTESAMASNHLILCLLLLLLPSIFSSIRVFSNGSALRIRWPKFWSFSISPSNEYSGLISFRIDWFDLLAVQGTLRSPLQHHGLKASILWRSTFFMVQLSYISVRGGKHARGVLTSLVCRSLHVFLPLSCCLGDKLFFTCPNTLRTDISGEHWPGGQMTQPVTVNLGKTQEEPLIPPL